MEVACVTSGAETFTANAYLVSGSTNSLVDAGAMEGVADVIAERVDTLESVFITHQHGDHIERLDEVRQRFDPTVSALKPLGPDSETVADGTTVQIGGEPFKAVHTPGHAQDHLVFVGETALFSGDIAVYNDGAFEDGSFGRTDIPGADREVLIESLGTLLDRLPDTVDTLYPGHGDVYQGDVRGVIERALERAERREPKYPEE